MMEVETSILPVAMNVAAPFLGLPVRRFHDQIYNLLTPLCLTRAPDAGEPHKTIFMVRV
jgi:hypothetical protein